MGQQHTFGGHALDRHIIDFETDPGGGDAGDGGIGGGDLDAGDAAASWALSQDDWSQFSGRVDSLAQTVETLAQLEAARAQPYLQTQQQQQDQGPPRPDPWSRPDTYEDDLDRYIESKLTPFQQRFESIDRQEGNNQILDVIHDLEQAKGEFLAPVADDMRKIATNMARELYQEMAAKFGHGDRAGQAALEKAFEFAKGLEARLAEAAVNRHTNEISTLAGAPVQPGGQYNQGMAVRTMPDWSKETGSIAQRLLAQGG